jgi:hypothetical protein
MRPTIIEEIVVKEFRGLCVTCLHGPSCSYLKRKSDKIVIQCELFEADDEVVVTTHTPAGLCKSCDLAADCRLPGRKIGIWHCNEFR